jgi:streptogramin lyase
MLQNHSRLLTVCALLAWPSALAACDGTSPPAECGALRLEDATTPPDVALAAGMSATMAVRLLDDCGPAVGASIGFSVRLGGGTVDSAVATTDATGRASALWTLGPAPVRHELVATAPAPAGGGDPDAVDWFVNAAPAPQPFPYVGDVESFLAAEGKTGSTEDLAFVGQGADARLVMGTPDGLIEVAPDGAITRRALTGEPIGRAWGLAAGKDGAIWAIDGVAKSLVHIDAAGLVTTRLVDDGANPLDGPNYVAVGPDGHVYVTDPCLGAIIRFDPDLDAVLAVHTFDRATDGGPNGLAFGPDGRLYGLTENTGVLCGQADIPDPEAPLAQLFAVTLTADGFGARETLAPALGVFGDGLAFDSEGNLYMVVDTVADFALDASLILVRPAAGDRVVRLVDSVPDVIANVAFGRGAYGETTLYAALLQIPILTPEAKRGLRAIEVGIPGLPLSF